MRAFVPAIVALTLVSTTAGCARFGGANAAESERIQAALRTQLDGGQPAFVASDADGHRLWKLTRQFYENRQYRAAWIQGASPGPQIGGLIEGIKAADREGLDPELYGSSVLAARQQEASKGFLTKKGFAPDDAGKLDVWLTYVYMKYASDLADGLSDLVRADPAWKIRPEPFDPLAHLEQALAGNRVAESLADLLPDNPQYRGLQKALADYREQERRGGWPSVPGGVTLKPGQRSAAVGAVAARLASSGDYKGAVPADGELATYDADLQEGVRRFQRRHGLQGDGVVNGTVVAQMNVPVGRRIEQVELNLERWRWLPRNLGDRYVLVNIPAYRLEVWDHGEVPVAMRVVVGKKDSPTPIFSDEMTHVVFSPYWNVPPDIAQNETLPSIMKDPAFLERTNMEVIDAAGNTVDPSSVDLGDPRQYRFRQRPGGANSLGLVKFMFPNQFNVYLHDTPADSLFARASRSFSHGCVRIEKPEALAAYVLRDQPDWTPERISEAMHAQEEKTVKLKQGLPVYLGYWTASVTPDGLVQFREDVYDIDARLSVKVAENLARIRKAAVAAAATVVAPKKSGKSAARPAGL